MVCSHGRLAFNMCLWVIYEVQVGKSEAMLYNELLLKLNTGKPECCMHYVRKFT